MAAFASDIHSEPLRVRLLRCLLASVVLCMVGCSRVDYRAASLPKEFRVPPMRNIGTINLTRLSSQGLSNSLIGVRDLLELTITSGYETERVNTLLLRVADNGMVDVPLIGPVPVAGLEPTEAEQNIASLAIQRGVYQRPYVTLDIKRQWVNKITVVGAVESQGTYELPRGSSDLLGALAAAGGLTEDAAGSVEVLRKAQLTTSSPSEQSGASLAGYTPPAPARKATIRIDLAEIGHTAVGDLRLDDGDVVMVFPQDPRMVHVLGLVNKPGQFEIPPNEDVYLLDALAWAGGRTTQLADTVQVIRRLPDQPKPIVIKVSVREAKMNGDANLRLAAGDLISVEETPTTAIVGIVKSFLRFGVSATTPLF